MTVSIVPGIESNRTVYQVLDDLGRYGRVWTEIDDEEANEPTILRWIIEGQFKRPLRVIAFNTGEGWSRDVTREIAEKLLDLNNAGTGGAKVVPGADERPPASAEAASASSKPTLVAKAIYDFHLVFS